MATLRVRFKVNWDQKINSDKL